MERTRSAVLETDIHPSCITILDWIICVYRLPPCIGTELILPCIETCEAILRFLVTCYDAVGQHINDTAVREHFRGYKCRSAEGYYDGYDRRHFTFNRTQCIDVPTG